jgi:hypothetical protein
MKKISFFSLVAALSIGFVACNNEGDSTASNDSTVNTDASTTTTTTTTNTSTGDYAALADSARINSEAGNYLDPKTGKSIRVSVDPQTGQRTNAETGEPVWRYVDKRTWWVYGGDNWDSVGTARMENDRIQYRSDNDKWEDYDKRWKTTDEKLEKDWKQKYGDTKVKVSKDGDIKIKDENGKVKYDADDNKIKTDDDK